MVFCSSVIFCLFCFLVLLFLLRFFVFSLLLRVGLRFSVIPPFRKNAKAMLAMTEITFTSEYFLLFLLQGRRNCVAMIPAAFSVLKATIYQKLAQ